jgi:hypothetical protein
MAMIRIADVPHPKDEFPHTKSQDGVRFSFEDSIYNTRSFARSDTVDTHDDIYNIRSRSKPPSSTDRHGSRMNTTDREDDDPCLRKPGDFKQKLVPTDPMANLCNLRPILAGIQGENASVACLSINPSHLRRHRDQSSLCLLTDVQLGTVTSRPHWSAIDNHLDFYDSAGGYAPA